jgi:hypothetical protein
MDFGAGDSAYIPVFKGETRYEFGYQLYFLLIGVRQGPESVVDLKLEAFSLEFKTGFSSVRFYGKMVC